MLGHLIWKESGAPCAHPRLLVAPIWPRPDAIEADSNISAAHAADFGPSLCKSRIARCQPLSLPLSSFPAHPSLRVARPSLLKNAFRPPPHEYPSIRPIMFSRRFHAAQIYIPRARERARALEESNVTRVPTSPVRIGFSPFRVASTLPPGTPRPSLVPLARYTKRESRFSLELIAGNLRGLARR